MRLCATLASATAVALLLPATGTASTVYVRVEPPSHGRWAGIVYDAAPGEVNGVDLFTVDDKTLRVTDTGAAITPGAGCVAIDAHTARCSTAGAGGEGLIGADVRVGDMNDVVNSHGPGLSANGGPGDDRIESIGPVAGTLNGGGGHDVLLGGTNMDTLIDGDVSGTADSDFMDGREGGAVVSYADRTARVVVDLADARPDGEPGEGDVLRSVHGAIGGAGSDVLRGDDASNRLEGRAGDDRLYGRLDGDYVVGGPGDDRVSGGDGEDSLYGGQGSDLVLGGGARDWLDGGRGRDVLRAGRGHDFLMAGASFCGSGFDAVDPSDERDFIQHDCELARFGMRPPPDADGKGIELEPYPARRDRQSATFRLTCPYTELDGYADGVPITGTVRLSANGVTVGQGRIPASAAPRCDAAHPDGVGPLPHVLVRVMLIRHLSSATRVTVAFKGRNVPTHPWRIDLAP